LCFSETGEMSSDVAQQVAYTQWKCTEYIKKAGGEYFECFYHEEMMNIWGNRYAYLHLNIAQLIHI
jgi:hypothetical protein